MAQRATTAEEATNDNQAAAEILHNALSDALDGEGVDYTEDERGWMHGTLDDAADGEDAPPETGREVLYSDDDYLIIETDFGPILEHAITSSPEASNLQKEDAMHKLIMAHKNAGEQISSGDGEFGVYVYVYSIGEKKT